MPPASSPTFVVGAVLDASYSNRSEAESLCGFDLHLFYDRDSEHFFMCFCPFGLLPL
jgi:hypothetical protein